MLLVNPSEREHTCDVSPPVEPPPEAKLMPLSRTSKYFWGSEQRRCVDWMMDRRQQRDRDLRGYLDLVKSDMQSEIPHRDCVHKLFAWL
jgi:hypothetical protein